MTRQEFLKLAEKYEKGTCSPQEKALFEDFCDQFKEDALKWDLKDDADKLTIKQNIYKQVENRIGQRRSYKVVYWTQPAFRVAAVLFLVVGMAFLFYNYLPNTNDQPISASQIITKETPYGVKTRIRLPDGTKVRLNAGSKLIFPSEFSKHSRQITLSGEAYFEVERDEQRPFVIKSGEIETTVLGTTFNIRAFENEDIYVTVATGKVRVSILDNRGTGKASEDLVSNQQAMFNRSSDHIRINETNPAQYLAWTQGTMIFDNVSLEKAARIIERWYGVEISFKTEAIKACRIKNEYTDETLVNVLEGLKHIFKLDYEITDDQKVILNGNGCNT